MRLTLLTNRSQYISYSGKPCGSTACEMNGNDTTIMTEASTVADDSDDDTVDANDFLEVRTFRFTPDMNVSGKHSLQ